MIRRTVARAFGSPGEDRPSLEKAVAPGRANRVQAMNALFAEIGESFEKAAAERPASGGAPALRVGKPRPGPEGIEFTLAAPAGSFRFLNAMDGIVWLQREEDGKYVEERLLSVLFEEGRPRLIEKPVGVSRAPFRFASVRDLVRELAGTEGGARASGTLSVAR